MEHNTATILAVDDNPDNLISIRALVLEKFPGFRVITGLSGKEGIARARQADPDVILLDILMPEMDGFEVCRIIKADTSLRDIPVVFLTALKSDKKNRIAALEAGADGFLNKPIDEVELAAQLGAMIKIKAAQIEKRSERERLAKLVEERTHILEIELAERKRAETALQKSEERYRRITEGITDYLYTVRIVNGKAVETRHTAACEKVTGYTPEDFTADPFLWINMIPESEREMVTSRIEKILAGEPIQPIEHRILRRDGELRLVSDLTILNKDQSGNLLSYDGVVKDITESRAIEMRLQQSEKMEAIGQLAGGIAHDFNNVLGGIMGYTDMTLELVEKGTRIEANLQKVLQATNRAKNLVRQILAFSRQDEKHNKSAVSLPTIIKEVVELLKASIPSSVTIKLDLTDSTKPVVADSTQIHEMILNLATNAVYAMERKGLLTIRSYPLKTAVEMFGRSGRIPPGDYTVIEVTDTGCGMDAQTLNKAFLPFFTTKPVGIGTGMGLSVVLGIVQSHGGDLLVESDVGKGTTFRILLPVATSNAADESVAGDLLPCSGKERILFVDDEPDLVEIAISKLEVLGYSVTGMTDSREALNYIEKHGNDIDILITDQTMPELTGVELAKAAFKIRSDLPVILCTGYSNEINKEQIITMGIGRLLFKPILAYSLAIEIRDVLDGALEHLEAVN